jgi:YDG domain-containing protein/MBG domain-containing protein
MLEREDGMRARSTRSAVKSLGSAGSWAVAVGLAVLVVGWPVAASALTLSPGDVLVGLGSSASPPGRGEVRHFAPDGTLLETLVTTSGSFEETGMCLDAARTLYTTNFEANSMSAFDATGTLSRASFGSGFNEHPNSCVVDAAGRIYVGQSDKDGDYGRGGVLKFNAAGTLLATFSPAPDVRGTDWVDLAADQCTLVYTSAGASIKRFDVCANAQPTDVCSTCDDGAGGATQGPLFGVRLLPDGGMLVADWNLGTGVVRRYTSAGTQVGAYTVANAFGNQCGDSGTAPCFFPWALALDPDRTSFWVADRVSGEIFKLALDDGTVLTRFLGGNCDDPSSACAVTGLAIVGEPTAAAAAEPISVTASITAADKTYDGTAAATITGCALSGAAGADVVGCTASGAAFATPSVGAGKPVTATVSLNGADAGKYTLAASTAATTAGITPAPASATPDAAGKIFGTADPVLTGTLSGFLAADGVTATYSRTIGENVAGSPYTISATLSPAGALGNYAITYGIAAFTITPATPIVTWADPADITYPTPLSSVQLDAVANVPGTFHYTPPAGTVLDVGNGQLLSVLLTPTDSSNYTTASAQAHINVLPATSASCPQNPNAILTRAVDDTGAAHGNVPIYTTLQDAYNNAAENGDVIGMFSQTTENVTLGGAKSLTITRCTVAEITAGDPAQPVWNITSTGALTIIGPDAVGGSIGWRIATSNHTVTSVQSTGASQYGILLVGSNNRVSIGSVSGSPVGIMVTGNNNDLQGGAVSGNSGNGVEVGSTATGNTVRISSIESNGGNGVQVDGTGNTVSGGRMDSNALNGILVNGGTNTIKSNTAGTVKGKGNGQAGLRVVGQSNTLDSNTANANGGAGFDIVGTGDRLKGNRANQSQSGNKENTACEYRFADNTTLDQGGNKKGTASFVGGLPGPQYPAGCYE